MQIPGHSHVICKLECDLQCFANAKWWKSGKLDKLITENLIRELHISDISESNLKEFDENRVLVIPTVTEVATYFET